MSQLGQTRKCPCLHGTSVAPSRADVAKPPRQVRFVPCVDGSASRDDFETLVTDQTNQPRQHVVLISAGEVLDCEAGRYSFRYPQSTQHRR